VTIDAPRMTTKALGMTSEVLRMIRGG